MGMNYLENVANEVETSIKQKFDAHFANGLEPRFSMELECHGFFLKIAILFEDVSLSWNFETNEKHSGASIVEKIHPHYAYATWRTAWIEPFCADEIVKYISQYVSQLDSDAYVEVDFDSPELQQELSESDSTEYPSVTDFDTTYQYRKVVAEMKALANSEFYSDLEESLLRLKLALTDLKTVFLPTSIQGDNLVLPEPKLRAEIDFPDADDVPF